MTHKYMNMSSKFSKVITIASLCVAILQLVPSSYAQDGPGGVGNTSTTSGFWFRADQISTNPSDGDAVNEWNDVFDGVDNEATKNTTLAPTFEENVINGSPALSFAGDVRMAINNKNSVNNGGPFSNKYYFIAFRTPNALATNAQVLYEQGGGTRGIGIYIQNGTLYGGVWDNSTNTWFASQTGLTPNTDYVAVLTYESGQVTLSLNGSIASVSGAPTSLDNHSGDIGIGSVSSDMRDKDGTELEDTGDHRFNGHIAEIIHYNDVINQTQQNIVLNYLYAKYNVSGFELYAGDDSGNGDYDLEVIGIGQASGSDTHTLSRAGGLSIEESSSTLVDGAYLLAGYKNDNGTTSSDLSGVAGVQSRWLRDWYFTLTNASGLNADLVFDVEDSGLPTLDMSSAAAADYKLIHRSSNGGTWVVVATANTVNSTTNAITFTGVDVASTGNGYYTLATNDPASSPVGEDIAQTWYSYTDGGDWSDHNTWTLDGASIPTNENPNDEMPGPNDHVVISSGYTVHIRTDNKGVIATEVIGALNIHSSSGHDLGTVTGNGSVLLQGDTSGSDNFPNGDISGFADATNGGTVVMYGAGFSLDKARTFNNLRIALDNSTDQVTLLRNYQINGNLSVETGTFSFNNDIATVDLSMSVDGDMIVSGGGEIVTGSGDNSSTRHQLNLYGDLINNGAVRFTRRNAVNYGSEATNGIVDVNFLSDSKDQKLTCNGTSIFYRIEIDKGISRAYELLIAASNDTNFRLYGYANQGHPQNAQLTNNTNALGLLRGTVRIGSHVAINRLNGGGNYNISENAQLWVDGGLVRKTNGTAIVVYGTARVSQGTLDAPINSGFTLRENGTIEVEGTGTLNANQIRTSVLGAASLGGYIQRGGTANLLGNSVAPGYYVFNLTYPGNVFTMTGGVLNIKESAGEGGIFINSDPANVEVTEGTVNLEVGIGGDMTITSRAPFYNLNMRNTQGNSAKVVLGDAENISSTNTDLAAQPLVVLNNFTIGEDTHFKTNGEDVTIGRNFTIEDGALYEFEDNTTVFNSSRDAVISVGDITELSNGTYTDPEGSNTYRNWEQPFYNMTVDKPNATLTLATSCTYSTTDNVFDDGSGCKNIRGWRNNLIKVANDFVLEAGTIDIDIFSVRLYGDVTNKGIFAVDFDPTNALVKLREDNSQADRTIVTVDGAEFGNLRFNSDQAVISITSDLYVKRLNYNHGRLNIGTYNLKIDNLALGVASSARFDYDGNGTFSASETGVFSPSDMIVTAGNASDGGISMLVDGNGTYQFPFGVGVGATELLANGAKYTPATVNVTNFTDDGYITINPADAALNTTNVDGGELLSYYWQVDHSDFGSVPTVKYDFVYDDQDVDGGTPSNWAAGKVLDANPYTRSGEDFFDADGNETLDAGEGAADLASVDESNNQIIFDGASAGGFALENANYTAGEEARFTGLVEVYYSRRARTSYARSDAIRWDRATSWSTGSHEGPQATDYPKEGDIAIIGGSSGQRRPITIKGGTNPAINVAQTIINRVAGDVRLFVENNATADLGVVEGNGTIQYYLTETSTPSVTGDFGSFANNYAEALDGTNGSRFLFYGEGGSNITLPATPTVYPNVRIEGPGNRTFHFPVEITAKGDMIVDNQAIFRVESDLLVEGELRMGQYRQGSLLFPDDVARTVTVKGRLRTRVGSGGGSSSISVDNTTENGLEHRLIVEGNIEHRNGSIDLFSNNTGGNNVILELAGDNNASFTKTVTNDPDFYRIVVNKGTNQDSTFTFEDEFRLLGPTDGNTKALELQNGTLVLDDADINIDLTTGGANFEIPSTAALEVRNGRVNTSGDDTGILLAGTLRLNGSGANLDMNNAGNGNNYIEYSVGNPTLEIFDGTLTVGSQIRRILSDDSGVLSYTQTGGDVTIGRSNRGASNRGMLEVVNDGQFVHTGGTLEIVRSNNSASVASLLLEPGIYDTDGSHITLGDGNSPNNQLYNINTSVPLGALTVNNAGGKNPTASLLVRPATFNDDLTVTNGATFDGNGLTLTLNADLVNDGAYVPSGNTTVFSADVAQQITGTTATEFFNLDKISAGTLTLDQQPILITNDLQMLDGTVADNGNTIEVRRNVTHDALHTSTGGQGLVFSGTVQQQLRRSLAGTSTLGTVTIRNSSGVVIPESNGFNFTIARQLRLENGVFNSGSSLLTIQRDATIEAVNPFGAANMIRTNSSFADPGVKKVFPAGANTDFIFPVGEDVYSPVRVDFTSVGGSIGTTQSEITVVPNRRVHPVVNDGIDNTLATDADNVLQYYWAVRTAGLSGFTADIKFAYDQSDVALGTDTGGNPYLENDYISARILILNGNTDVNKFTPTSVDEATNEITFSFSNNNDNEVYGDYFAGIDPAIPDDIPVFTSRNGGGDYTDPTTWDIDPISTPFPAGGPRGSSIIVIESGDEVLINRDDVEVFKTTIEAGATLKLGLTNGHNLGIVSGQGTINTETGTLPAGLYTDFFTCTGGEIDYSGTGSYSVFKGNISLIRRVTFSGSGSRTLPNKASVEVCEDVIIDDASLGGAVVGNPSVGGTEVLNVGGNFLLQRGTYRTGDNTLNIAGNLLVGGTYEGEDNHQSTIQGDVTITAGTFNAGNGSTIGIEGDLSYVSGTFTSETSRIIMQGSSPQTISGAFTGAADMDQLEIDNSTGVTMGGSIDIDTELALTNGLLTPGANKLLLSADAVIGGNSIGNATTYVNGTLCKIITNSEEFYFPVGRAGRWGYASVDPVTNDTHEWCVDYYNQIATTEATIDNMNPSLAALARTTPTRTISENEYWRIEDDATGVDAIIGLRWDGGSDVSNNPSDWYALEVMKWNGAAWDAHNGTGHDSNPSPSTSHGFFKATSTITFSERFVTLGSTSENNALPVELISFTANAQAQSVKLNWETASEIDNDYFEVQRSVDGMEFKKIGEVNGNGNTSEAIKYTFEDKLPITGVAYYRLKQVDFNGMYDHSDAVSVEWINDGERAAFVELNLYPNPATGGRAKLRVTGLQQQTTATVKLLDMFGKVYLQKVIESGALSQDGYLMQPRVRLASGVYVVSVQQGNQVHQKTLIIP